MTQPQASATASLARLTLGLQAACLLACLVIFLVERLAGGLEASTGVAAAQALQTIGSIAMGGGVGGGAATVGHGLRHYGTRAPTSAMTSTPRQVRRDPDESLTVPS